MQGLEHERKFLLAGLPAGEAVSTTMIRQAYWILNDDWSLRVRREGSADEEARNSVTLKGPWYGSTRPELDLPIVNEPSATQAALGLFKSSQFKVVKTRHSFLIDELTWDIDQFHWENEGLYIAELEMDDPVALARVRVPVWAIREVTRDRKFNNDQLAIRPFKTWT